MSFGKELHKLRTKAGKSRYAIWRLTGLDQAFLARLENETKNPSRNTVILLGLALVHGCNNIGCNEIDELLLIAGYAPLRPWPRTSKTKATSTARVHTAIDSDDNRG